MTTQWEIRRMVGFYSNRPTGYTVERIHNPYTEKAKVEFLEPGRIFRTEADARAAIAKATGETT